jgi:putative ABC transport system ATP-binding protein/macrolide transport system ATP-binding/permease protein/lipoprotein-releasing system ATP-binding protein
VTALDGVSLTVAPREFVAIVGRSGSGKSTLLATLGGQSRPSAGSVLVEGIDLWRLGAEALSEFRRRQVGFVFQFPSLLPSLRAIDNVALPALLAARRDLDDVYGRAQTLLRQVGLGDRTEAYPDELSGGQQRRVALARALINRPKLLLADEPTGDLDENSEREVLSLLLDLHRRHETALVVVTHSARIAEQADRVIHLEGGRILATTVSTRLPTEPPIVEEPTLDAPVCHTATSLGRAGRRLLARSVTWVAVAALVVLALNFGAALVQRRVIEDHRAARRVLETAAMQQVRAEVQNLEFAPDGAYRLTLYLQNIDLERELYVLGPAARVFVQVDRSWVEVPLKAVRESPVIRLTGRHEFVFEFKPELAKFEEQLAGYMHVRVVNTMLFSRSRQPQQDLFERTDDYYVYLKCQDADDAEIVRRNKWSATPPRWIPMPPH